MQTNTYNSAAPNPTTVAHRTVNGIDVAGLQASIDEIKTDPRKGETTWRVHSKWMGGTRSDHHVRGCDIGGAFVPRPFVIKIDEPCELAGTNEFANPQEYLLAAINACMMVGYSAVAAIMGIKLTKLELETTGDIDLRGFLGISESITPGYLKLEQTVRIDGNASAEKFDRLHDIVRRTSPNFFNITRAIPMNSRMMVG